jgi:hypothetical protein
MKSFFFKGVISIFIVLRGPWPRPRRLSSPRYAPRTNALRARATYVSLLLSFAIHNNLAQAQQLSNRKYASFKRAEVPRPYQQRVITQPRTTQKNIQQTASTARPSINISKIAETADDKNKVANKTTKSEKKEK